MRSLVEWGQCLRQGQFDPKDLFPNKFQRNFPNQIWLRDQNYWDYSLTLSLQGVPLLDRYRLRALYATDLNSWQRSRALSSCQLPGTPSFQWRVTLYRLILPTVSLIFWGCSDLNHSLTRCSKCLHSGSGTFDSSPCHDVVYSGPRSSGMAQSTGESDVLRLFWLSVEISKWS